jgi:hypothetical protein
MPQKLTQHKLGLQSALSALLKSPTAKLDQSIPKTTKLLVQPENSPKLSVAPTLSRHNHTTAKLKLQRRATSR